MTQATGYFLGGAKARRSSRSLLNARLLLLTMAVAIAPVVRADAPKTLSGHEISERNKPGVVLIYGVWQAKLRVWNPGIKNKEELQKSIRRQIRAGLVHDVNKAMLEQISQDPDRYLTQSGEGTVRTEKIVARGSGFIITPDGYIITNNHVVSMDTRTLIRQVAERVVSERSDQLIQSLGEAANLSDSDPLRKSLIAAFREYFFRGVKHDGGIELLAYDEKPEKIVARVPVFNGVTTTVGEYECDVRKHGETTPGKDVAVLKIEANNLPTVPVGDDSTVSQGDQIFVLGFPAAAEVEGANEEPGVEATLTAGRYSRAAPMPGGWKAIQTDAAINHGNSGGPGFSERGEVIGIATFGAVGDSQGLNYLVPMSVANQFIQELNIKPRDSELSAQYREALGSFEAGDFTKARLQLVRIKEESRGFPFVQEYIDRIPNGGGFQYWPTLIWVGVAAVLLLAIGGFVMAKRKPQPAPAMATAVAAGAPAGRPQLSSPPAAPATQTYGSLQCVSGPLSGQRFPVPKQGLLIGRDASKCQIVLSEDDVSKEHAWVVPLDSGVVLIDRGSTNGVFVNSMDSPRVSKVPLKNGDRILIGRSAATFTYYSV